MPCDMNRHKLDVDLTSSSAMNGRHCPKSIGAASEVHFGGARSRKEIRRDLKRMLFYFDMIPNKANRQPGGWLTRTSARRCWELLLGAKWSDKCALRRAEEDE